MGRVCGDGRTTARKIAVLLSNVQYRNVGGLLSMIVTTIEVPSVPAAAA